MLDGYSKKKKKNPNDIAQIIGSNVHKILISDNDLLWIKTELRAAIWLSYFMAAFDRSNRKHLLKYLRSTSEAEFTNRLLHVIDIYGCGSRGDTALIIKIALDQNQKEFDLPVSHRTAFNYHQGSYVSSRIADHHLNWLNKLPLDEIDAILERFRDEEILVLVGIFEPVIKKDKTALIKASLDIQQYNHWDKQSTKSLKSNANAGKPFRSSNEPTDVDTNKKTKKKFAGLSAYEIIKLLKNARISRENRKARSAIEKDRSLTLNKNAHSIIIELSNQLMPLLKKSRRGNH